MQAGCGTIITDIGGDPLARGQLVQGIQIGALVHEATLDQRADKLGFEGGHDINFQITGGPGAPNGQNGSEAEAV